MKTLNVKWTGIRPLLMHNGLMADPTNPLSRRIREITAKGSKKLTESDYEERDRLEWDAGLYWHEGSGPYIPSDNIERCIQLGAQKSRKGKDIQAAVFVHDDIVKLNYEGSRKQDVLFRDPRFSLRKGVCIKKSRIIRVRPMFPAGWWIQFTLEYDDTVVNVKDLTKAMVDAGSLVGLGDWRPKYGRFEVE